MAFAAKDGKKFTNKDTQRSHDAMSSAKPPQMEGEPDGDEGGEGPEQIVAQHGPAHTVHIAHDHEMGVHEVHSDHPSGHHHMSQHGSVEEAHQHAQALATAPQNEMEFEAEGAGKTPHGGMNAQ